MTSLKDEPAIQLRSMSEFTALARSLLREAEMQYIQTARHLRAQRRTALADVFEGLAETVRAHRLKIDKGSEHPEVSSDADHQWTIPNLFDLQPKEVARSKLLTPYQAFAFAVRHEQRSFKFWSYVAAHTEDSESQTAAESMARDALESLSMLRQKRRQAYFAERRATEVRNREDTLSALAGMEQRLSMLIARDHLHFDDRSIPQSLAQSAQDAAAKLLGLGKQRPTRWSLALALPPGCEDNVKALSEYLAEAYLALANVAEEEHMLGVFQELGRHAVQRLAALSSHGEGYAHGAPERRGRDNIE